MGVILVVSRVITRPIDELQEVIRHVAEDGNLHRQARIDQKDELGQMAASFNALLRNLQRFVIQVQDEVTHLALSGDRISNAGDRVSHQMRTLDEETTQVATAMTELSTSADEVSRSCGSSST